MTNWLVYSQNIAQQSQYIESFFLGLKQPYSSSWFLSLFFSSFFLLLSTFLRHFSSSKAHFTFNEPTGRKNCIDFIRKTWTSFHFRETSRTRFSTILTIATHTSLSHIDASHPPASKTKNLSKYKNIHIRHAFRCSSYPLGHR